jgi:hypothetical protein
VVGRIELQGHRFAAHFLNLSHYRICFRFLAVVGQDNVMPFFSQPQGHALSKAATSVGYDRNFHYGKILPKIRSHNEKCVSIIRPR